MTTTTIMSPTDPDQTKKSPTVLKKVLRYFQDQALEHSSSKTYLTPPGPEPQQRTRHRPQAQQEVSRVTSRTFSDATTAVERFSRSRAPVSGLSTGPRPSTGMAQRTIASVSQDIKKIQYANENLLQSYELYEPELSSRSSKSELYWIVYIHGGYFKDPKVDAASFRPALELLTAHSPSITEEPGSSGDLVEETEFYSTQHHIAGYASLNYRLSPNSDFPQDPATIPNYELRNARWPDHLNDVHTAIKHLQSRHGFASNYILSGHSVGATLAFTAALSASSAGIPPPKCVVGLNGIYDFPAIHKSNPDYESMTKNAMKPEQYREASPALCSAEEYASISQAGTNHFLISHSRNDGLVVWEQSEEMSKMLEDAKIEGNFEVKSMETDGQHDDIWQKGKELARTLKQAVEMVAMS